MIIWKETDLINNDDAVAYKLGYIKEDQIRKVELKVKIDTGYHGNLFLPKKWIDLLDLDFLGEKDATLAGGVMTKVQLYSPVILKMQVDGHQIEEVLTVRGKEEGNPLLGMVALENLSLGVDPVKGDLFYIEEIIIE